MMKRKELLLLMFLALFSCVGMIGCDLDDEDSDSYEIRTCEVSAHKVMKEVLLVDRKEKLEHFELTYENGQKDYVLVSELKGFEQYEEGFVYKIKLKVVHLSIAPQDWQNIEYSVVEILSKNKYTAPLED